MSEVTLILMSVLTAEKSNVAFQANTKRVVAVKRAVRVAKEEARLLVRDI